MQGQHDPEYASIIKAITAIIFLATPHRGTALAQTLNRILDSIMVNSKQYVAELGKNSLTLQKLNEQFRHVATKLDIISFYETLPTPIGLRSTRVVSLILPYCMKLFTDSWNLDGLGEGVVCFGISR